MWMPSWRLKKMDSKPTASPKVSRTCPNCYYPLPRFGKYCSHCGQKYTDGRVTVGSLVWEFIADTFNLDSKIWRTLVALLVPGKLTRKFFEGKQQRYVKPVRLFFVFALVTVAAVSMFEAEFTRDFFIDLDEDFNKEINYTTFLQHVQAESDSLRRAYPGESTILLDSLTYRLGKNIVDSTELGIRIVTTGEDWKVENRLIAKQDVAELSVDSLLNKYDIQNFWERLIMRQNIRLQRKGENFAPYILNQTVWMMLLLMPLLAVLLKLLYVRHSRYYVEHLIFSFHTHSFVFLLLIVLMLLDNWPAAGPYMGKLWIGGFVLIEFYFYLALRRVYQQSRFKTWLKFLLLNLFYMVLFFIALILTIILAALFY